MRVTVRTFAMLRELSADRLPFDLPDGSTLADAWQALQAAHPAVEPHRPYVRGARNGGYAAWEVPLADGDEVAFLPPVSGGSGVPLLALSIAAFPPSPLLQYYEPTFETGRGTWRTTSCSSLCSSGT